jgi:hypothetical protein
MLNLFNETRNIFRKVNSVITFTPHLNCLAMNQINKQWVTKKNSLCLLLLLMSFTFVYGQDQDSDSDDHDQDGQTSSDHSPKMFTERYNAAIMTSYSLPDGMNPDSIPKLDLVRYKPINEKIHKEKIIYATGDFSETTIYKETDEYPHWMKQPSKEVIDKNGARIYDSEGKVLAEVDRGDVQKASYEDNKSGFLMNGYKSTPIFVQVSDEMIRKLVQSGIDVRRDTITGTIVLRTRGSEIQYNSGLLTEITKKFSEEGNILNSTEERRFHRNPNGKIVPFLTIEKSRAYLSNGICIQKTVRTNFSNYHSTDFTNPSIPGITNPVNDPAFVSGIKAYPIPASNIVNIDLPVSNNVTPILVKISVIDAYTKTWLKKEGQLPGTTVTLDINNIPSGLYSIVVEWNGGSKSIHFQKN